MNIIFCSPPATGKTYFKEELKKHFNCDRVFDDGECMNRRMPGEKAPKRTLILCSHPPSGIQGSELDRDQMNRAMVAVGGIPIWNDDGSVNTLGKRKGLI